MQRIHHPGAHSPTISLAPLPIRVLFLLALLLSAATAPAHELYLDAKPSLDNGRVLLELRLGHELPGEPVPRLPNSFQSLRALRTDGTSSDVPGVWQIHPAGFVPQWDGTPQLIVYRSQPIPHRLGAERFERYLKEEGLDDVRSERLRLGTRQTPGRERYVRCAASLVAGSADLQHRQLGERVQRLTDLDSDCRLQLRLTAGPQIGAAGGSTWRAVVEFDGKPLPGALVRHTVWDPTSEKTPIPAIDLREERTHDDGTAQLSALSLDRAQAHRFHVVHAVAETDPQVRETSDWLTFWTSLTLDLTTTPSGTSSVAPSPNDAPDNTAKLGQQPTRSLPSVD